LKFVICSPRGACVTLASQVRIDSPLATHVLVAMYVATLMRAGLALHSPAAVRALSRGLASM